MKSLDYALPTGGSRQRRRFLITVGSIFAVAMIAITVLVRSMRQGATPTPATNIPMGLSPSILPAGVKGFDSLAVFAERIEPVLRCLEERNNDAARRAVDKIHEHFKHARSGAPEFAESIIGPLDAVKTTYLASKGVFFRWRYEDPKIQPVADHVRWNYEQHVTSGPKMRDAILEAISGLEQDFRANRNEAIQAIVSSLHAANLPAAVEIDQKKLDDFCQREFESAIAKVNTDHVAEKAAVGSAGALLLSNAAMIIAERAIIYVLGDAIATAGGSVAGGTAGGAAAGSWIPGAGTAIGAATGLLTGIAVDMWISHKNKERTTKQVTTSLSQLEEAIVNGDEKRVGIEKILGDAGKWQAEQLSSKLKQQLKEAAQ